MWKPLLLSETCKWRFAIDEEYHDMKLINIINLKLSHFPIKFSFISSIFASCSIVELSSN